MSDASFAFYMGYLGGAVMRGWIVIGHSRGWQASFMDYDKKPGIIQDVVRADTPYALAKAIADADQARGFETINMIELEDMPNAG